MPFIARFSIIFLVSFFVAEVHAEVGGPLWVERMKSRLHLDDAQVKTIRKINQEAQVERKALREKIAKRIDAVLTVEQRQKLEIMRKKHAACSESPTHCQSDDASNESLKQTPQ